MAIWHLTQNSRPHKMFLVIIVLYDVLDQNPSDATLALLSILKYSRWRTILAAEMFILLIFLVLGLRPAKFCLILGTNVEERSYEKYPMTKSIISFKILIKKLIEKYKISQKEKKVNYFIIQFQPNIWYKCEQ